MALNKRFEDTKKIYNMLGYNNADCLFQAMGKSPDYMYMGFLTQKGTDAPTSKILYDDFLPENGFSMTYEGTGVYRIYCNLFKPGYMEAEVNEGQTESPASNTVQLTVYDGYLEITTYDGGGAFDDVLNNTPFKIKVWTNAAVIENVRPVVPTGFRYFKVNDPSCSTFSYGTMDWAVDNSGMGGSIPYTFPWDAAMATYPLGGGAPIEDLNVSSCYGPANAFVLRTIGNVDPGYISVTDGNGNLVQSGNFNLITSMKCFVGLYDSNYPVGTQALRTLDFVGGEYSLGSVYGFDASDPSVFMSFIETGLLQLINNPAATATATNIGGTIWELRISNIYTNATSIDIKVLSYVFPVANLVETPC